MQPAVVYWPCDRGDCDSPVCTVLIQKPSAWSLRPAPSGCPPAVAACRLFGRQLSHRIITESAPRGPLPPADIWHVPFWFRNAVITRD